MGGVVYMALSSLRNPGGTRISLSISGKLSSLVSTVRSGVSLGTSEVRHFHSSKD